MGAPRLSGAPAAEQTPLRGNLLEKQAAGTGRIPLVTHYAKKHHPSWVVLFCVIELTGIRTHDSECPAPLKLPIASAYRREAGALIEQVDKLEDIIFTKYLKAHISYDGFQRLERYIVPKIALREGLLNAIVHRDYASYNNIQIKVFDDHIVIYNPGHLPDNWTLQDLTRPHYSCPYNPLIAGAFTKAGEIEKWGRGIETMLRVCKEANMPKLKYEYKGSYTLIFRAENNKAMQNSHPSATVAESILALMRQDPAITRVQLAKQLGVEIRTIDYHIKKYREKGIIQRKGSRKSGVRFIQESAV